MTFNLMRIGWPNTAAILALAALPFVAVATLAGQPPAVTAVAPIEVAANGPTPSACSVLLATADPQSALE
jgi:hypothetical protein